MQKAALWVTVLTSSMLFALACGGKDEMSTKDRLLSEVDDDVDLYEDITGIDEGDVKIAEEDTAPKAPTSPEPEVEGEPIDGPQGAFVGTIVLSGQEAVGSYTIKTVADHPETVVADVASGAETSLEPGVYDVVFTVTSLAGNPSMALREVPITAGRRIRREAKMPAGEIVLVPAGTKRCKKMAVRIKDVGATDWYEGQYFTCESIRLRAGEYNAEMGTEKNPTPIEGIQVYDGSKRNMHIQR